MTKYDPNRLIQVKAMWKQTRIVNHTPYPRVGVILQDGSPALLSTGETDGMIRKARKAEEANAVQYGKDRVATNGKGWIKSRFSAAELKGRQYPTPRVPKSLQHLIKKLDLPSKAVRIAADAPSKPMIDLDMDGKVIEPAIDVVHVLAVWQHHDKLDDVKHIGAILADGTPVYFSTSSWFALKARPSVGQADPDGWEFGMWAAPQWIHSSVQLFQLRTNGLEYGVRDTTPSGIEIGTLPSLKVPLDLGYLVAPAFLNHIDIDPDTQLKYQLLESDCLTIRQPSTVEGVVEEIELYRIVAVKTFEVAGSIVSIGDRGGYVAGLENLDQDSNCWVADDAQVYGYARVYHNALVADNAVVKGGAHVSGVSRVKGNAVIEDHARISEQALVRGEAHISGSAKIRQNSHVDGSAEVTDNATVRSRAKVDGRAIIRHSAQVGGDAKVKGNAIVEGRATIGGSVELNFNAYVGGSASLDFNYEIGVNAFIMDGLQVMSFAGVGSDNGVLTAYRTATPNSDHTGLVLGISVTRGCFNNTLEVFEEQVEANYGMTRTHSANKQKFGVTYKGIIGVIRHHFSDDVVPKELQAEGHVYPISTVQKLNTEWQNLPDHLQKQITLPEGDIVVSDIATYRRLATCVVENGGSDVKPSTAIEVGTAIHKQLATFVEENGGPQ